MDRVANKTAIVTGAANGIGRCTARQLADEGAFVCLADIDEASVTEAAAQLGPRATAFQLDVRDQDNWAALFAELGRDRGQVDILVNNAGVVGDAALGDLASVTLDEWRSVQSVNVEGVLLGCQQFVRAAGKQSGGSIVNLSSMAGLTGTPGLLAYGASKAAVWQLTKSVALHCAREGLGIRCNSVHPGFIATEMVKRAFSSEKRQQLAESIPGGAMGEAADVAQAILYLASDESSYVTGTRLIVDGGVTLQ